MQTLQARHWLVIWPTVLFFALLGYGFSEGLTIVLDSTGAVVGLAVGAALGALAAWGAFR